MNRFFLPFNRIINGIAYFTDTQRKQISNVLRLKSGSIVHIFNGEGTEYVCELISDDSARIIDSYQPDTEAKIHLTLFQGLPKGDKADLIVQKCTEIGVARIAFVRTSRSIPKIDEAASMRKMSRWNAIAIEAAEQCGRVVIPEIIGILGFQQALAATNGIGIMAWEEEKAIMLTDVLPRLAEFDRASLFIGSEGGFSEDEAILARDHGIIPVSLGKRILRTETAAIVGSAAIIYGFESINA